MKYFVFLTCVLNVCIMTYGCRHRTFEDNVEVKAKNIHHLFKSRILQDSLDSFTAKIDSIPNLYGAPLIYMVVVEMVQKDTLVEFIANWSLIEEVLLDTTATPSLMIKGGGRIDDKTYIVFVKDSVDISNLINTEILTLDEEDYNFFKDYNGPLYCDRSWYPLSLRKYKLCNKNSPTLLKISKNKYEKP